MLRGQNFRLNIDCSMSTFVLAYDAHRSQIYTNLHVSNRLPRDHFAFHLESLKPF